MNRISCIICAYNESARIKIILDAVQNHPDLYEVIVVNDGSSDDTLSYLTKYPRLHLITYPENRGKTYALSRGIGASRGETLMLLDADLSGITAADISALAAPILKGHADVSISLRRNSLRIYRLIGLDFVSGERLLPRALLSNVLETMETLPRWGGEVFMNRLIIKNKLRVAVVRWQHVYNIRKYTKVGVWQGISEEIRMIGDAVAILSLWGTVSQNVHLLRLKVRYSSRHPSSSQ